MTLLLLLLPPLSCMMFSSSLATATQPPACESLAK
jgi:hypothetical protein